MVDRVEQALHQAQLAMMNTNPSNSVSTAVREKAIIALLSAILIEISEFRKERAPHA